jgi:phage FluMu protein Com
MKTIGYIVAVILIFFGVLFIWGAFGAQGQPGWIVIGAITVGIGLALVYFASRKPKVEGDTNVTLKVDLPANVNMDSLKCKSCGGVLTAENIKVVNGAPMVTCPYCHTVYQITEEPKW